MTRVEIVDPRSDPEPAGWAEFRHRLRLHPLWAYDLMGVESWLARNSVLLATARRDGRIVAALTATVCLSLRGNRFAPLPARGRPVRPHLVEVARPWLSGYPGVVFDDALGPAGRRATVARFERALTRRLGPGLVGVLYRQLGDADLANLTGRGRLTRPVDPVAVLHNTFADEEQWLSSLHKKRRSSLLRQARAVAADPTLVVRGGAGRTDLDATEASSLINRHRAGFAKIPLDTRSPVAAAYLARFLCRADVHTLTYHDSTGRLLALNIMLDNENSAVLQHWASVPVTDGGRRHLYFDAYRRAVGHLVASGRPELTAGRGMLEVKSDLGFGPRSLHTVAVPRPLLGRLS
ncbi:MAG TPA: GNAT family N-acetyltransferase [Actinophytocola sp.]|nr:GNAT family N-acetyltransferase [Actinophytocola sp.]